LLKDREIIGLLKDTVTTASIRGDVASAELSTEL